VDKSLPPCDTLPAMDTPGVKTVIESKAGLVNAFILDGHGGVRGAEWTNDFQQPHRGLLKIHNRGESRTKVAGEGTAEATRSPLK
jgi:hypothetical protein